MNRGTTEDFWVRETTLCNTINTVVDTRHCTFVKIHSKRYTKNEPQRKLWSLGAKEGSM